MKVLVAQLGARMHYAVPQILQEHGLLSCLHTDICATRGVRLLGGFIPQRFQPLGLRRFLGRVPIGVPVDKIHAYSTFGWEYARRRRSAANATAMMDTFLWAGEKFNRLVLKKGLDNTEALYVYNTAGLELLREGRRLGLRTILEQTIAPCCVEQDILDAEYARFPELRSLIVPKDTWCHLAERETAEWELADVILCGSHFVVSGIAAAGGPVEKCVVVPYGIDLSAFPRRNVMQPRQGTLQVLFAGEVGVRKGAHYLIEAARLLESSHPGVRFRMVGRVTLPERILQNLPANLELTGSVPRTEMCDHYAWADVFCLPSLCEGSATVTYEALAMGLPVICTLNAGSVVTDGREGLIIPPFSAPDICNALIRLADKATGDYEKLYYGTAAIAPSLAIDAYAARLIKVIMPPVKDDVAC